MRKDEAGGRTLTSAVAVEGEERVVELSRMLSGHPDSDAARAHARELLGVGPAGRGRSATSARPVDYRGGVHRSFDVTFGAQRAA